MRKAVFLVLFGGFLGLQGVVGAQSISPDGANGSSLQGSSSGLQQPISGFQGTSPSSLTAPPISKLNQNTRNLNSSSIRLKPSVTSTSTTPVQKDGGQTLAKLIVLGLITAIAGFFLWRHSSKLYASPSQG